MNKLNYTTYEISRLCNVYPSTVINWINKGLLLAYTTAGGHRRIRRNDLIELIKRNNMPMPEELVREDKIRILVVDDDPKIGKMVKTILEAEQDLEVAIANSGFEAGVTVAYYKPDLILLDFLMPDVDGFKVCQRLRKDEKTKNIPIIAITVLREEKEIKKMYRYGITDYLAKPFKSQDLLEKVKKYLRIHT